MKTHNILSHKPFVLEAEDDLFPGLDSSVLGSKKKEVDTDGLTKRQLEVEVERLNNLQKDFFRAYTRLWDHFEENDALQAHGSDPNETPYLYFDWLDKYESVKDELSYYGINKNSPLFSNIEKHVRALDDYRKRQMYYSGKAADLQTKIAELEQAWYDEWGYEDDGMQGA